VCADAGCLQQRLVIVGADARVDVDLAAGLEFDVQRIGVWIVADACDRRRVDGCAFHLVFLLCLSANIAADRVLDVEACTRDDDRLTIESARPAGNANRAGFSQRIEGSEPGAWL
jgi:hypothetical protein